MHCLLCSIVCMTYTILKKHYVEHQTLCRTSKLQSDFYELYNKESSYVFISLWWKKSNWRKKT